MKRGFTSIELLMTIAVLTLASFSLLAQDEITDGAAIKTFLHDNFDGKNAGMVIGLADEHGYRTFSVGGLDNGTGRQMDGDTVGISMCWQAGSVPREQFFCASAPLR